LKRRSDVLVAHLGTSEPPGFDSKHGPIQGIEDLLRKILLLEQFFAASSDPCASHLNFANTTSGSIVVVPTCTEKPQSTPASNRSGETTSAQLDSNCLQDSEKYSGSIGFLFPGDEILLRQGFLRRQVILTLL